MKIGILSRSPHIYSTKQLVNAAKNRGHEVDIINHLKCYVVIEKGKPEIIYEGRKLAGYDAIIPRIGASVTFYGTAIVRQFEMRNVFSANESQAIVRSRDKLRSMQILSRAHIGMPKTCFARTPDDKHDVIEHVGGTPLIIKLLEGTQGVGVMLANSKKEAESILDTFYGLKVNILIQEFIKESNGSDLRVIVVDGKVVAAMKRQAHDGEFRSNIHRGGSAETVILSPEEHDTAIKATEALGLYIAGVDLLQSKRGPLVMEVNSSPGLEGIEKTTMVNVSEKIIEMIEQKADGKRQRDVIGY
ncbi:MAG TPA: 30S ribosomal protein S6--L-glutamate ligase [Balneolales bacterium]|nr:30S ribosomal protein S6--L-glutamate ligase [Balneolales bacterium]